MTAYAIAHLRDVRFGPEIARYVQEIDATLAPHGGLFRIHGGRPQVVEGSWSGDLVVIEFPDLDSAKAWYGSGAYQAILPLRTRNAAGEGFLVEGVSPEHRASDILKAVA